MENLYVGDAHGDPMKYAPLGAYLDGLEQDERALDLKAIQLILDFNLPASAQKKSFWSNDRRGKAQVGPGWLNVGWRVKTLEYEHGRVARVTFVRTPESRGGPVATIVNLSEEDIARMQRPNLESQQMFYYSAGDHMMNEYSDALRAGEVRGVNHRFDFISEDGKIVGEMRLFKSVPPRGIHSSTHASISEAVLLLEHTRAKHKFIVFGGDQRVPEAWLSRHAALADGVAFYYIRADGKLILLHPAHPVTLRAGSG